MNNNSNKLSSDNVYTLTERQLLAFNWLKQQGLNTDDNTLNFWCRKYSPKRIVEVVRFAQARREEGQCIRNIGGWIHKLLITGLPVVNDECKSNREMAEKFAKVNKWNDLSIYEKYVRDRITDDDLPLTIPQKEFMRALEGLYQKSKLYNEL